MQECFKPENFTFQTLCLCRVHMHHELQLLIRHSVQQSLCLLQGCVNDQRAIQSADRDTYQSYDVENCRCTIWQPTRAVVVHCEVRQGLEEDQV